MRRVSQSPREPEFVQDPYSFYDSVRPLGPLFFWEEYGFPCAAGYEAATALLRDRRFGRALPPDLKPARPAHLADFYALDDLKMHDCEPPTHTRLRRLVQPAFTPRRISRLAGRIEATANGLIDDLDDPEFDLVPAFAERLPVSVIAWLLGVPEGAADQLLAWSRSVAAMYQVGDDRATEDRANAAARAFADFLAAQIEGRRARPGDDLLSHLVAGAADGERLSAPELIATCSLLLSAGNEATVHAIGNGVRAILASGRDAEDLFAGETAIADTVEEILRFDPPVHLFTRYALEEVTAFGHRFRRGERVGCLLGAANRDPKRFEDPARFEPARAAGANLAFGAGIHFCLGASLARLELAVALPLLFRRFPGLALAETPVYADRYHFRALAALRLEGGHPRPAPPERRLTPPAREELRAGK